MSVIVHVRVSECLHYSVHMSLEWYACVFYVPVFVGVEREREGGDKIERGRE